MLIESCNVTLNSPIGISMNRKCEYVMLLQYSEISFNKQILIKSNMCHQIIVLKSNKESAYIKVMEYSSIIFHQNNNSELITVDIDNNYYNFYPVYLFQYVSLQSTSDILPSFYTIIISDTTLPNCKSLFYHLISYCQWIHTAVFHDHNSRATDYSL